MDIETDIRTHFPHIEQNNIRTIFAGIDEAGRGPLAGPVVAAAVIANPNKAIEGIKDSKKLSAKKRESLYEQITNHWDFGVGIVTAEEIDEINILEATKKACIIAQSKLQNKADWVLIDGNMKFVQTNFLSIVKGDQKIMQIAAASIIAKVTRDRLMNKYAELYPEYKWEKNFGYGTKEHIAAIKLYGLSAQHRKTFKIK